MGQKPPIERTKVLSFGLVALWTGLLGYVGFVQLGRWKHYERLAFGQQGETLALSAARGRIFDSEGRALTLNRSCCSIRILPQWCRNRDSLAGILARFGLGESAKVAADLKRRSRLFWFARRVDFTVADSLRTLLAGRGFSNCVYIEDDNERSYPYGEVCANVVGFVGDERGLAGIESEYDPALSGQGGWLLAQKDAIGRKFPNPSHPVQRPVPGSDIHLTLDLDVQAICYEALKRRVDSSGALHGSAVVLDTKTGEVLGLAEYPSYDPARFAAFDPARYKSPAVTDQFEPGSSFKVVACAAALESPDSARLTRQCYDVSSGFVQIGRYKINDVHRNGVLDFAGLFIKSSNPGCALLSMQLRPESYYELARALGFGHRVGIGLPGEGSGWMDPPSRLNTLRFANVAFGQGVTVTLLQLAAAYSCIANDGAYIKPYLIRSVDEHGRAATRTVRKGPLRLRQPLRLETARRMKDILERVVTEGTGLLAQMEDAVVCGKTGTAQKTEPGGGYSKTRSRMTFIGFFPKADPRYVIAVLLDEPKTERFAGTAACPVFRQIGEDLELLDRARTRQAGGSRSG
jgi:cell division protein FtsI/penicillin-binding protein 2